ncbi:hypothetical protein X975_13301, partial [Stegodyphus mimosarum]
MNFKKSYVIECLTRGRVKTPVSLKQQTLDNVALRICDNWAFRQHLYSIQWYYPYVHYAQVQRVEVMECISREYEKLYSTLSLPQTLQECLIKNIQRIIMQLFKWIGMWKFVFDISSNLTADYWEPSDWAYGRLNERKIAELLILEKRISVYQSYRLSCTYCLEELIPFFWDQLSLEEKEFLASNEEHGFPYSKVIVTWSRYMRGQFENQQIFLGRLFFYGLCLAPLNNVPAIFSWSKLNNRQRRALLSNIVVDKESDTSDDDSDGNIADDDNEDYDNNIGDDNQDVPMDENENDGQQ